MKCTECATPLEKSLYFALEHEAHDLVRSGGGRVYLYMVEGTERTLVKIGTTTDLVTRIASFGRPRSGLKLPDELDQYDVQNGRLYAVLVGGRRVEAALHAAFAEERVAGEWFEFSDRLACVIESLLDDWCGDDLCFEHTDRKVDEAHDKVMRDALDRVFGGLTVHLNGELAAWDDEVVA